jgi:hypothetical protein
MIRKVWWMICHLTGFIIYLIFEREKENESVTICNQLTTK